MEEKKLEEQVLEEIQGEEKEEVTKEVKVLLNVDYKTLTYYNVYYLKHVKRYQLIYIIMIVIAVGFGVYNYISTKSIPLTVIMGLFAAYMLYSMLSFTKTIDKQLTQHFNNSRPVKQLYTMNNLGFNVHSEGKEDVYYEWTYVTKVHITPAYYYLFLGKTPLIIDRNPDMIVSGTVEDLDSIIEEVAKAKPVKRYDKEVVKNFKDFNYPDYDEMDRARAQALAEIEEEERQKEAETEKSSEEEVKEEENKEE